MHDAFVNIKYFKPPMIVFEPRIYVFAVIQLKCIGGLPSAVVTQKLTCDRLVYSQGLPVYQVRMSPVETIGLSVSKTGTSDSVFSLIMLSHICWTTLRGSA